MKIRVWFVVLACALVALPARAATSTAADLAAMFAAYGNTGEGWTGADGTYSVPLPDGRTAWLFSDTFLGPVNADGSRPSAAPFIHNSIVVQDGSALSTIYDASHSQPLDAIKPEQPGGYYWMGDGTVEDGALKVFVMRFVAAPIPFGFQQAATDLATLSLPDLTVRSIEHVPYGFVPAVGNGPVTYGNAIMETQDYTYVYGVEDLHSAKFLHLARAPAGHVAGPWEFWTGTTWSSNPLTSARLLDGVSNELSVQRSGDGYVLVAQNGAQVIAAEAAAPEGPWGAPRVLFETPETSGSVFTYNAKAHPELGDATHLLVTYNVNTTSSADLYGDVTIYRPRFVELDFNAS